MRSVSLFGTAALLGLSATVLMPAAAVVPAEREPLMRVLLNEGTQQLTLRADGSRPMRVRGVSAGIKLIKRLVLRVQGGGLTADVDGTRLNLSPGGVLRVENDDPRGIWLGQRRYRGELQISSRGGRLRVVNQLGIEIYLASVVGSEMPHHWPLAALQAQAVAARTYALRQRGRGGGWDVKATVASQVYRGVESETDRTREAVNSTHALVLVHRGKLINAVFHSSSGGVTEASGMVWKNQLPYLISVQDHDQHSPVHRWQKRFDRQMLRQSLPETGGLESVEVLSRSGSGRVRKAIVRGPRGALLLSGRQLRQRLGLKSTLVEFEMVTAAKHPKLPPLPLISTVEAKPRSQRSRIDRITASVALATPRAQPMLRASASAVLPMAIQVQTNTKQRLLLVRGQGFGHGVGMSQWGAHGLAEQGADFRTILRHYYRGADVVPFRSYHDPAMAKQPPLAPLWRG